MAGLTELELTVTWLKALRIKYVQDTANDDLKEHVKGFLKINGTTVGTVDEIIHQQGSYIRVMMANIKPGSQGTLCFTVEGELIGVMRDKV